MRSRTWIRRGTETDREVVLRRVNNHGMCLNLFSDRPGLVRILSAAAAGTVTVLQVISLMRKKGFWKKTALSFLSAVPGATPLHRFARGYVVDYIGFKFGNEKVSRITYNLGDFFIGAGAAVLSLAGLFEPKEK